MPIVDVTVSRSSSGADIQDSLTNSEVGLNHGDVPTNTNTLEEILYISHFRFTINSISFSLFFRT